VCFVLDYKKLRAMKKSALQLKTYLKLTALVVFTFSLLSSTAQVKGGKQDKLFDMFLMENYEGCLSRALKLTEKDEFRNDPEPLLYVAMCYYQISLNSEMTQDPKYKNAYKDALKFAAKANKKDKEGTLTADNEAFFTDLKARGKEEAQYFYNEDNFSKAASTFKNILKVDEKDEGFLFMTGLSNVKAKNVTEGQKMIEQALALIKEKYSDADYKAPDITYDTMIFAILQYTNYLNDSGDTNKAQDIISAMRTTLKKDDQIKKQYERIMK
jgi:hypothetical protein